MSTQNPLISLCQDTKSQESLRSFTEMHYRMKRVTYDPRIPIPLCLYTSTWPKQGKFGMELIEEMNKPALPTISPFTPTHQQPPIKHSNTFLDHLLREKIRCKIWNQTRVDSDLCDWKGRQVVFPQPDGSFIVTGRRSQPGFS